MNQRLDTPARTEEVRRTTGEIIREGEYLRRTVPRNVQINVPPHRGVTRLRHQTVETGTGASVSESNSQINVTSGTDGSGRALLRTRQRGQVRAGTRAEAGVGVTLDETPTGSQDVKWGYFDDSDGLGFGRDSSGIYIFRRTGGATMKTYQSNWNRDPLDRSGPSALGLDLADGHVFNMIFEWYGHGPLIWRIDAVDEHDDDRPPVVVHRSIVTPGIPFEIPDQPLTVEVDNGGTASSLTAKVTTMQFALKGDGGAPSRRETGVIRRDYTISTVNTWEPVIAVRKRTPFQGKTNSILLQTLGFDAQADALAEVRMTFDAETSGANWTTQPDPGDPNTDLPSEFGAEVVTDLSPSEVTDTGVMDLHGIIPASGLGSNTTGSISRQTRIPIDDDAVAVLWVQSDSQANFGIFSLTLEGQW